MTGCCSSWSQASKAKAAIGKRVTIIDYPDGRLAIRYRGIEFAYRTFDKIQQVDQGAIIENKRARRPPSPLSATSSCAESEPKRRSTKAPRRRDQRDVRVFFKVG